MARRYRKWPEFESTKSILWSPTLRRHNCRICLKNYTYYPAQIMQQPRFTHSVAHGCPSVASMNLNTHAHIYPSIYLSIHPTIHPTKYVCIYNAYIILYINVAVSQTICTGKETANLDQGPRKWESKEQRSQPSAGTSKIETRISKPGNAERH